MKKINKAFTLIELLIVMAILGVLATFVIVNFTGAQARARDTRRKAEIRQYQTALEVYANANNSLFPSETTAINAVSMCASGGDLEDFSCQDDPHATNGWHYMYQSDAAGTEYILWGQIEMQSNSGASAEYFVVCSTGEAGIKESNTPTQADCSNLL